GLVKESPNPGLVCRTRRLPGLPAHVKKLLVRAEVNGRLDGLSKSSSSGTLRPALRIGFSPGPTYSAEAPPASGRGRRGSLTPAPPHPWLPPPVSDQRGQTRGSGLGGGTGSGEPRRLSRSQSRPSRATLIPP